MKGDFSRDTFNASQHFLRVLMQQGRVQLDADWNEQVAILLHYLQNLAKDLIGPYGGPMRDFGFEITLRNAATGDFRIESGKYYVEGILCENDHEKGFLFSEQPDYPLPENFALPNGIGLVYLDVWERHVTWIDEPSLHEPALGSVDTATRAKLMCQVKVTNEASSQRKGITKENIRDFFHEWIDKENWQPPHRGLLIAMSKAVSKRDVAPCTISPEARYRGPENQLYRVEIHAGGTAAGDAKYKWSRDNGAIVFPIIELSGNTAFVEHLSRDDRHNLAAEQWVEISDDDLSKRNEAGALLQIESIDAVDKKIMLRVPSGTVLPFYNKNDAKHPILRRWESGATRVREGIEEELEDGIMIEFEQASGPTTQYRVGDYWLIPARTANGEVLWPSNPDATPAALPPHGVTHHYAPLWIINVTNGSITLTPTNGGDCRCPFPQAAICPPLPGSTAGMVMSMQEPTSEPVEDAPTSEAEAKTKTRAKPRTK